MKKFLSLLLAGVLISTVVQANNYRYLPDDLELVANTLTTTLNDKIGNNLELRRKYVTAIGAVAEYAEISDNLVDILYFTQFQISKVDDPYVDDIELPGLNSCLDMSTNKVLGQYEQYEFGCSEFDTEPCNWKEQVLAAQSFLTDTPAGQRIVKKNQIDGAVYMVYDREKNIDAELLPFLQEKDQIEPLFDSVKSDVDPSMIPRVLSVNEAAPEGLEYQRHVVTIPWTSFYDQDAAEGLLRYEKTYSDNCAEAPQMGGDPAAGIMALWDRAQNFDYAYQTCARGVRPEVLEALLDDSAELLGHIRYRDGLIGFHELNNYRGIPGQSVCPTDAAPSTAFGVYYITYDKDNYYAINLSAETLLYLMDYEKMWFGKRRNDETPDYYKNRIIGTVQKEDGTYPRLKQFVKSDSCEEGRECVAEIQEAIGSYLNDLASGKVTSPYFDREMAKIKERIDLLYQ